MSNAFHLAAAYTFSTWHVLLADIGICFVAAQEPFRFESLLTTVNEEPSNLPSSSCASGVDFEPSTRPPTKAPPWRGKRCLQKASLQKRPIPQHFPPAFPVSGAAIGLGVSNCRRCSDDDHRGVPIGFVLRTSGGESTVPAMVVQTLGFYGIVSVGTQHSAI